MSGANDRKMAEAGSIIAYLPDLLLYPLRGTSFLVIVLFGSLAWAFSFSILFFAIYLFFFSMALLHYFFSILEHTILGHGSPPALGSSEFFNFDRRPEKLTLVAFIYFFAAGLLFALDWHFAAIALAVIVFFLLPSSAVLITVHEPVWVYANPYQLAAFTLAAGPGYWVFAGVFAITATYVFDILAHAGVSVWQGSPVDLLFSPRSIQSMIVFAATLYLSYLLAHLLGYLVHHRHEELNIKPMIRKKTGDETAKEVIHRRMASLWQRIDRSLRAGNEEEARRILMRDHPPGSFTRIYHEELFERALASRVSVLFFNQGRRLIEFLLKDNRLDRALDIVEICLDRNAKFEPAPPPAVCRLAEAALLARRHVLFERLLEPATERYASKPELVEFMLLKARYLVDVKNDEAGALAELERMEVDASHPCYSRYRGLRDALRAIAAD